jgi:alpha,alpha-trehalose phosphorylase
VLQAGARGEERPIAAKGLTGPGYDGHCFWDTETFVLPVLIHTAPGVAADVLRWRHKTLPLARERASQLGLRGAAFPWRTINGEECSGYWPAGTAAFHINADIADAVTRYHDATLDDTFDTEIGMELLVETARLWVSLGSTTATAGSGSTASPARTSTPRSRTTTSTRTSWRSGTCARGGRRRRYPRRAQELNVTAEEVAAWRRAAESVVIPWDEELGVHPQSEGFTRHAVLDFESLTPQMYPLLLHLPYYELYRKQVVKQADLVLAMQLRGDAFTAEQKAANFAYYERITVRDSSLSAAPRR